MKVRYIGPGRDYGIFKTEDLTIGKEYDVLFFEDDSETHVNLKDDAGHEIIGVIKDREDCPFEEYFELVTE